MVGGEVAERRVPAPGVVTGDGEADFKRSFGRFGKAAAVEQFGPEVASKRFGMGRTASCQAGAALGSCQRRCLAWYTAGATRSTWQRWRTGAWLARWAM